MSDKETKPTETEWGDHIVCPYCGYEEGEYTDYPVSLKRDGDSTSYSCSSCDTDFTVSLSVDYSYKSYPVENKS